MNGNPVMFPHEESVPYHIYFKVLNSKKYNVPQNRERVFIVGIRDDSDNVFHWPKEEYLKIKVKDILENNVSEKYNLSEDAVKSILFNPDNLQPSKVNPEIAATIQSPGNACGVYKGMNAVTVKSNTKKGYDVAEIGDTINFAFPKNETKRGRVGKGVCQTIDTLCTHGVVIADYRTDEGLRIRKDGYSPCLTTSMRDEFNLKYTATNAPILLNGIKIRRLTPRECFRLMDFPDTFKWNVSDSQAYKQAGNSIVAGVLEKIIRKLNI